MVSFMASKYGDVVDKTYIYILAFIEFEERRDAEDACKELNGIKLEGERISVEMSKVRSLFY